MVAGLSSPAVLTGAGLVLAGNFVSDPKVRAVMQLGGAALVVLNLKGAADDIFGEASATFEDLSVRTQEFNPGGVEGFLGFIGRAVNEPPPIIGREVPDMPADPAAGFSLGKPKNLLGVAGAVRWPMPGTTVQPNALARTWNASMALENQSNLVQVGKVTLVLRRSEDRFFSSKTETIDAGVIDLQPGEFTSVSFTVPGRAPLGTLGMNVELVGYFGGHALDRIQLVEKGPLF